MIFFGWGFQTTKNFGIVYQDQCSNCKNNVDYELKRTITWFTLFFVPVIPYGFEYWANCPVCSYGFELNRSKFNELIPLAQKNLSLKNGNLREIEEDYSKLANDEKLVETNKSGSDIYSSTTNVCSSCGQASIEGSKFCKKCGTKVLA